MLIKRIFIAIVLIGFALGLGQITVMPSYAADGESPKVKIIYFWGDG